MNSIDMFIPIYRMSRNTDEKNEIVKAMVYLMKEDEIPNYAM